MRVHDVEGACPQQLANFGNFGAAVVGAAESATPKCKEAIADMDKAESLRPPEFVIFMTRALMNQMLRNDAQAVPDLQRATELNPRGEEACRLLVAALVKLGRSDEAANVVERAREQCSPELAVELEEGRKLLPAMPGPLRKRSGRSA